jgi:glutathione S-transferase
VLLSFVFEVPLTNQARSPCIGIQLKRVNPSALVPTLIPVVNGEPVEGQAVWESLIAIDYIDQVANPDDPTQRLVIQNDPYQAARCRLWTEKVNRECCSPYYGVLVRKDDAERRDHFHQLIKGLENFAVELRRTSGPLFLPDGQLSNVDLALLPWAYRYYVLEHYRGADYAISRDNESLAPYFVWYDHLMTLECVQRTLPDRDRYLDHIQKYADGTARSKVANAVRRGVAAHDFDDDKDNY